ncbi:MAG: PIG-L family deacetylase [Ramlibacter sp.]|nr:PIG-L family deacetylase [Ramlibacter sp.]
MAPERILLLGAHTDDGEWGCGASIHKWASEGAAVTYVAFSAAEESLKPEFPRDILRKEILAASKLIGIQASAVRVLDFPVRKFPAMRQEILEVLVALNRELNPDLILVHGSEDTHQDHETLSREAFRAFKKKSILGYEVPHNNRGYSPAFFSAVSEANMDAKIAALESYQSQSWRLADTRALLKGLATVRGAQAGVPLAEAFEVLRWQDN